MSGNCGRRERLPDLIGNFYEAALDDWLWADISPAVAAMCDAPSVALQLRDNQTRFIGRLSMTSNYDAKSIASYAAYYFSSGCSTMAAMSAWLNGSAARTILKRSIVLNQSTL